MCGHKQKSRRKRANRTKIRFVIIRRHTHWTRNPLSVVFSSLSLCLYRFMLSTIPQSIFNESLVGWFFVSLSLRPYHLDSVFCLVFICLIPMLESIFILKYATGTVCRHQKFIVSSINRFSSSQYFFYIVFFSLNASFLLVVERALIFSIFAVIGMEYQQKNTPYRPPSTISNIQ